jgi:hypothetical protein
MNKQRIIIDVDLETVSVYDAVAAVVAVIAMGKISKTTKDVEHYCWHSTMKDGIEVSVRRKKPGQKSDSFIVYR